MTFYQDRYITFNDQSSLGWFFILSKSEQILSKTVNTQDIQSISGVKVKNAKYNSKIIKLEIMFTMEQLRTSEIYSIYDFKRFIANYFDSNEAVKFWDSKDPDVYCNAIFQGTSEITFLGNHTAKTEVELLIPSGLYYSTTQKEFTAELNDAGILESHVISNGTAESIVDFEITNQSDNGYIGIVSENGVMEFGKRDEADGIIAEKSVVLTRNERGDFANWTDATVFAENSTKKAVTKMTTDTQFGGRLGILQNGFTNTANSAYFGAIKEYTLSETASNWYLWAQAWFETGLMGQTGMWTLTVVDKNNLEIASMHIYKTDTTGNQAKITFATRGRHLKTIDFTPSYWVTQNPYGSESRNAGRNPFDIKKEGSTIRFFYNGQYFTFTVPEIATMEAQKIQFFVGQFRGRNTTNQKVTHMYLNNLTFIDTKVPYWKDVPNRYKNGDLLRIDGETRTPYLNELPRFEDQLKGTEYFKVKNGDNKIEFYYSDFATQPGVKIYLREAYI